MTAGQRQNGALHFSSGCVGLGLQRWRACPGKHTVKEPHKPSTLLSSYNLWILSAPFFFLDKSALLPKSNVYMKVKQK